MRIGPSRQSLRNPLAIALGLALGAPFGLAQVHPQTLERATPARPGLIRVDPSDGESIRRLIADLGASDYATREAATMALADVPLSPEDIARFAPPADSMGAEQWDRFESVVATRFAATPRAGLGVQFAPERTADVEGVVLAMIVETFPAHEFLQKDDIVTEIDGRPVLSAPDGTLTMQASILSHDPGETVALKVLRLDEEGVRRELSLRVPLGSYAQLGNGGMNEFVAERAWEVRRERMGLTPPSTPLISLRPEGAAWPTRLFEKTLLASPAVIPGGRPGAQTPEDVRSRLRVASQANQELLLRQDRLRIAQPADLLRADRANDARARQEATLRNELNTLQTIIRSHRQRLADPNMAPDERARFEDAVKDLQSQAIMIHTAIQQLAQ